MRTVSVTFSVNGREHTVTVPGRELLVDTLRDRLGLTGTHIGCEHGVCGACTVLVDGSSVRSCLMFTAQADQCEVGTVEGLAVDETRMHPLQEAFSANGALQCGFCTPGFLMSALELLYEREELDEELVRTRLSGNLCRCTGYHGIVKAVLETNDSWERATDEFYEKESDE